MHPGWEHDASARPVLLHLGPRDQEPSGAMHMENQPRQDRFRTASGAGSLGGSLAMAAHGSRAHISSSSPFSSLTSAVTEFAPSLSFLRGRGCVCPPAQPPHIPEPLPHSGTGHKFYPHPRLETRRQAGAPSPQMSLKWFGEGLIPSLLNAWKLLTLNLYRHN